MRKVNVKTDQLETIVRLLNDIYQQAAVVDPDRVEVWREWRAARVSALHSVRKPSARPYAARVVADIAIDLGKRLLDELDSKEFLQADLRRMSEDADEYQFQNEELEEEEKEEVAELREEVERLQAELTRKPLSTAVTIPERTVAVASPLQQEMIRLLGEGVGRSWRIYQGVMQARLTKSEKSAKIVMQKLIERGLVADYEQHGKAVRWAYLPGGSSRLLVLTEPGRAWYRQAYGKEPVESEVSIAARQHRSVAHGVAILEARDLLRDAGYIVDDAPEAILKRATERWGERVEPDLIVYIDDEPWPVEVQREVAERLLDKWAKALRLTGRLVLVLFNVHQHRKQEGLLCEAVRKQQLPGGSVFLLTSLEELNSGEWEWSEVSSTQRGSVGRG